MLPDSGVIVASRDDVNHGEHARTGVGAEDGESKVGANPAGGASKNRDTLLRHGISLGAGSILERYYLEPAYVVAFSMFLLYLIGAPPPTPRKPVKLVVLLALAAVAVYVALVVRQLVRPLACRCSRCQ